MAEIFSTIIASFVMVNGTIGTTVINGVRSSRKPFMASLTAPCLASRNLVCRDFFVAVSYVSYGGF